MKSILILGAGRSATSLIHYLVDTAEQRGWQVMVADYDEALALEKAGSSPVTRALKFNIHDTAHSQAVIEQADVVISLLPAALHPLVAKICLVLKKHLLNASYVSQEISSLHAEAKKNGLLFLNECGLDPGIDHMTAMKLIDEIKAAGGKVTSFESFTGGLIAPTTDPDNPWRYKFTWNPRNVVVAGQGTAKYLMNREFKYIPYQQIFSRITSVNVLGACYEGYANRDCLKYRATYGLDDVETMLRGTLRNAGYCSTWNILVTLGCCDDTFELEHVDRMSHRDFIESFLDYHGSQSLEDKICQQFNLKKDGPEMQRLRWSGFFSDEKVGLKSATPAKALEHILNKKWKLEQGDRDLIVMWHRLKYLDGTDSRTITASLIVEGEDALETAMAKTVGLPLGIAAKLLLEDKLKARGVVIPTLPDLYLPILAELEAMGIRMMHQHER